MSERWKRSRPGACASCAFEGVLVSAFEIEGGRTVWLCRLCAETPAGMYVTEPQLRGRPGDQTELLRTVCYVGNVILAALADGKPRRTP